MNACDARNDEQANYVRLRVCGAVSDLHAVGGQYHQDCYKTFTNHRNVQSAVNQATIMPQSQDPGFEAIVREKAKTNSRVWNS